MRSIMLNRVYQVNRLLSGHVALEFAPSSLQNLVRPNLTQYIEHHRMQITENVHIHKTTPPAELRRTHLPFIVAQLQLYGCSGTLAFIHSEDLP